MRRRVRVTGRRGADFIIVDDPLKPEEALSNTLRKAVTEWFDFSPQTIGLSQNPFGQVGEYDIGWSFTNHQPINFPLNGCQPFIPLSAGPKKVHG